LRSTSAAATRLPRLIVAAALYAMWVCWAAARYRRSRTARRSVDALTRR
jgi:hypothetical protein